ncbi:UDP-forming cellulose synthase catalytic subunit [Pseudomonas sp. TH03]|uniref:UDP-forming cellulose synthase catalytic subunit n=1 Tax=Pseudomonas sp. TH03 TaxID=2796369 RepID=UPI00191430DC|nr:UDP-forming cellulose synthase catalytic subunit [Pseudomonas sp. TH03]MBK5553482.1 UDP-forming cellulose synthase catalytic subunit [Pseudomonas sp. TH03]
MTAQLNVRPAQTWRLQGLLETFHARFSRWPERCRQGLKISAGLMAALLLLGILTAPLDLYSQAAFAAVCFTVSLIIRKHAGRLAILTLITLSLIASLRYMYWRLTDTLDFDSWLDAVFGYGLVLAELYALLVLVFGYVQTAWPLHRKPQILQQAPDQWPTVDIFIPTYNEALSIVKLVVLASQSIDWPEAKLRVHVLDDGRREEFRVFCEQIGVNYITRDNNQHAKAGNLNEALKVTDGEFIAIFDADHVPTRSFLQVSMGWFFKDPNLALLQTPHFFYSPDPFEKNLDTFRSVPNEGELFYGLVQDGNDLWNATFFCGSCAVMRRTHLLEVGGIATETVTEDAHTALKLNRRGFNTAYLAIPQAAGLATENLSRHISQRIRWARGMAQIFRTDNPLLGKGLNLGQRICYLNAMMHFFYSLPRLVFLTAPLAYLIFGAQIFHASALMVTVYVLPHIFHSSLTNSSIQGRFRHSFWNEVYESVLAWYIMRPVLFALINPSLGTFNVTDKGGTTEKEYFDWKLARPYIVLLTLNMLGLAIGSVKLIGGDGAEVATLMINLVWTLYNIIIVSTAVAVASESSQIRSEPRVPADLPVRVHRQDGTWFDCTTQNFSQKGVGLNLPDDTRLCPDESLQLSILCTPPSSLFPATAMFNHGNVAGVQFDAMPLRLQSELVRLTFSRADTWASSWGNGRLDAPMSALREVSRIGLRAILGLFMATLKDGQALLRKRSNTPSPIDSTAEMHRS